MRRYASEFDVLEIPNFVKRIVFPLAVLLGRMLGRYEKFRDAPEPIRFDSRPAGSVIVGVQAASGR